MRNNNDIIIGKGNKYSKIIELLYSAKQSGVDIILNKDQLQLKIHEDKTFDEKLLLEIRNHKPLIIEFLSTKNLKSEKIDNNQIRPFDRSKIKDIPLSFSQERLWFIDQLEGSIQYHISNVLRIKGELDVAALNQSFQDILNRHEVLRTVILTKEGHPYQCIKKKDGWLLNIVDGSIYEANEDNLNVYVQHLINKPFDLSKDSMLRASLIELVNKEHLLVLTLHHIASDGWSRSILVSELVKLYNFYSKGVEAGLSSLPIQYADFSVWQRSYLQGETWERKTRYWKDKLVGVSTLQLPLDYKRPTAQSTKGSREKFAIDKKLSVGLQMLNRQQGTTMFMTLLSVFKVLLYRYSGQKDICVGTPIAGRQKHELEGLIGFFVNTLALRDEVNGSGSFTELLHQVKRTTLEAYEHQDVPFEKVVDIVVKERDISRNPLFQVMFVLQNTPEVPQLYLGETQLSRDSLAHDTARFDITFTIIEVANMLQGSVEYCTDLYSKHTIDRMIGHFTQLISSVVAEPDEAIGSLQILEKGEELQLLEEFNNTEAEYPKDKTIIDLFEEQVVKTPEAVALIFKEERLTYRQLNERSNRLGHYLKEKGVRGEALVPICIERGIEMVVGILGILKSGGAYVPVDTEYPAERISYILKDTGAAIVVSNRESRGKLSEREGVEIIETDGEWLENKGYLKENLRAGVKADQLAYVIYTSGSTGTPKGVMVEHGSLVNYLLNSKAAYIVDGSSNAGSFIHLSYTFDASLTALFMPLLSGNSIIVGSKQGVEVFEDANLWKYAPYDFLKITPSHLELLEGVMRDSGGKLLTDKLVIGGEALRAGHFTYFVDKGIDVEVINEYGPTEATVGCTTWYFRPIGDSEKIKKGISVGKPVDNAAIYILGKSDELVPVGVLGEICIGGAGIARGYLNRPALTAEKFIAYPFGIADPLNKQSGSRIYRTGDIGRWLADGNIEYIGRKDDQVKIKGYRIELGEIESVLLQSGTVNQAVVVARDDKEGNKQLTGYVVPDRDAVKAKERELYAIQVATWKELYETEYEQTEDDENIDPEFNIIGWGDSFTGKPIPGEQMQEWLNDIVSVIMSENPERVLEIGCGTGLIYYQLAGKVKKYTGIDLSRSSINQINARISKGHRNYGDTELWVSPAHNVSLREDEQVDTIILNSMVQYFPGEDYMSKVIEKSILLLKGKGRIIIGDIRDNRLLSLFKARLNMKKLQDWISIDEFKWMIDQEVLKEEELCFAPDYFYRLKSLYPQITHIDIQWKHGVHVNELSLYRYTVIIYVGIEKEVIEPKWQNWENADKKEIIKNIYEENISSVALKDIPNPRLWKEKLLNRALNDKSVITIGDVMIDEEDEESVEAGQLLAAANEKGYAYRLLLDEDPFMMNLFIEQTPSNGFIRQAYSGKDFISSNQWDTNTPLFTDVSFLMQKDIRNFLQKSLPDYMVPLEFIALDHLPLTINGKIDRLFLSRRKDKAATNKFGYQPPRTEIEQSLASIWQRMLNADQVGIHDNFFDLGGHSLMATRIVSAIRRELEIEVVIKDLFIYPTVAELSGYLQGQVKGLALPSIGVQERPEWIPLSFSQERLWFIDQLEGSVQYHIPSILRLKGTLDVGALSAALASIVDRHEVLRTVILHHEGEPYQYVKEKGGWCLGILDGREYVEDALALQKCIYTSINKPFDLSKDDLLRADLIGMEAGDHILVVTFHHIVSDGWSTSVLVRELVELYRSELSGAEAKLSVLPIQYADYSIWQRKYLQGEVWNRKMGYWKAKLEGVAALQLPTDFRRPLVQSKRGTVERFSIEKEVTEGLQMISREQGVTMFMMLLSVFKVLLYRYSGQQDICIGTPIAGRQHQELEGLIGFFVNTLALRDEVNSSGSFTELLQQVKKTTLEAYEHQEVPFEKVVEAMVQERDLSRSPLFQVMFMLQNTPEVPRLELGEVELSREVFVQRTSKFDLSFNLTEMGGGVKGSVQYCTDLYSKETIGSMVSHFLQLISSIIQEPGQAVSSLPMLAKGEGRQLEEFNHTEAEYPNGSTIVELFEEQALKTPEASAVIFEQERLTFWELNERSNRLGHYLREQGVKAETLVPICIERGIEMIVGILGILKAGGAYVPIDPEYPADRINYMLEDTGAGVIVSSAAGKGKLPAGAQAKIITIDADWERISKEAAANLQISLTPHNLAYVIYTSGSTGRPKGVLVEHGNVVSLVKGTSYVSLGSEDRLLSTGSSSFDATTFEYWGMLLNGGQLILCEEAKLLNSDLLKAEILHRQVTKMWFTSSWLNQLVENDITIFASLQTILAGGEKLSEQHILKIRQAYPHIKIINGYGPTENTTFSLTYSIEDSRLANAVSIPIGRPLENRTAYIVDEAGQLVPVGVPGEIFLGGAGLARGYLNQPALTAEKFIASPFGENPFRNASPFGENPLTKGHAGRIYKTGDLGRWLSDGNIEYLGRKDDQVKLRGYRIELGEIENVLMQSELVRHAVVLVKGEAEGSKQLVGYIVPKNLFNKESLVTFLQGKLPGYMIPSIWAEVAEMPLTNNGKIDKKVLAALGISEQAKEYVAPVNELEEKLVAMWQQMLRLDRVGTHDNFFELGGHSLLAMRIVSAVRKQVGIEMPIKDLFLYPTISKLATHLAVNHTSAILPAIKAVERPAQIPLSFSQERLWFIDQMEGSVQYHIPMVLHLKGRLDKKALRNALKDIVNRHEALRTVFTEENGEVWQQVQEQDLWQLEEEEGKENKEALNSYIQLQIRKAFDLSRDSMLRASLITLGEEDYILVVTMHHIASDGWSMPILVKEVTELYAGYEENKPVYLKPLPVQYADYSIWQRNYLQGEILEKKIDYWKEKLNNVASLEIPGDYQRPKVQSTRGAVVKFSLEKRLSEELQALSQKEGTTLFMTMLSGLNVLLYRYSGQQDICIGSPVANRTQEEIEGLIGFFVNTLALRSEINAAGSFADLLQQVKATTMEAYNHQDVPFEKVVESVVKERDLGRSPLFQVMLVLQNAAAEQEQRGLGAVEITRESVASHTSKFDLTFSITENAGGLHGSIEYNTGLYKEETIERMAVHFEELLSSIVRNPQEKISAFKMLTIAEEDQLLNEFVDTTAAYPKESIVALFEEQVQKTPDNIALVFEGDEITYQQINNRSNQLARYLQKQGVKAETLVPICIERGIEMIVGILGILKAGGAYVPIDPEYPADRINYMLEDTGAGVIVSSAAGKGKLPAGAQAKIITIDADWERISKEAAANLQISLTPHNLAYVIYTSGSTGRPKGVLVEHGNVVSLVKGTSYVSLGSEDRLLSTGSSSFDATTFEYWGMLLNGGQLILCEEAKLLNSDLLKAEILHRQVTKMWFTSSWLNQLVENDITIFASLQTILAGGEKLSEQHILKIRQAYPHIKIINGYGPTENTTFSLTYSIEDSRLANAVSIPIGRPLENRTAYIVDEAGQLVPVGVPGEIFLGGAGLARGYLNQPALTAEKFIASPFGENPLSKGHAGRIYKTGDLGRWLSDGNIEYLGRKDDQVKLRGYRIELGEIENVLMQSELVRQAVVLAPANQAGHKNLAAYIVANADFDKAAITAYLHNKLPAYMIPAIWIPLEKIPLTPNGKVDKKALPEPDGSIAARNEYIAPANEIEGQLAEIWQELLGIERVGRNDNFFEIGGDSILTIQVMSRARRLGYDLKPKDLFMHQTIANLALAITQHSSTAVSGEQGVLTGTAGLLPIQQWYLENAWKTVSHFNQTVLLKIDKAISPDLLANVLEQIVSQHDALRFKYFKNSDGEWTQEYGTYASGLISEDLRDISPDQLGTAITQKAEIYQRSLDMGNGDLTRMVWMHTPEAEEQNRLLIIIHHLAVDGVSWRILIENVEFLIAAFQSNQTLDLGVKTTSYRQWYEALKHYGQNRFVLSQVSYWETVLNNYRPLTTYNDGAEKGTIARISGAGMTLETTQTTRLIKEAPKTYNTEINDILLCALSMALSSWGKTDKVTIGLEGHGREDIANDADTSRTVGWFTNLYPVLIEMNLDDEAGSTIKSVKKQLRSIPDKGLGFGVLKYINKENSLSPKAQFNIVFNYLGQLDSVVQKGKRLKGARESAGQSISNEHLLSEHLTVTGSVKGGRLTMTFRYNTANYTKESIAELIKNYQSNLELLINHCILQQDLGLVAAHPEEAPDTGTSFSKYNAPAIRAANNKYLIPIKTGGKKVPLYIVAGGGGTARKFMNFAKLLDDDQPVYSLQPPLDYADVKHFPKTIEEIAARFIEEMIQQNPKGHFSLSGHCTGGLVAIEMARQLKAMGKKVHIVAMFDTVANKVKKEKPKNSFGLNQLLMYLKRFVYKAKLKFDFEFFLLRKYKKKAIQYKINSLRSLIKKIKKDNEVLDKEMEALEALKYSEVLYTEAHKKYECFFYEGELVVFYAKERYYFTDAEQQVAFKKVVLDDRTKNLWKQYAKSLTIHETQGDHSTMFETEHAKGFADTLQRYLDSN